jgi:folate-binding protein YgfZ
MASLSLSTSLRSRTYVCDTCLNGLRSARVARLPATRTIGTGAWQVLENRTRPLAPPSSLANRSWNSLRWNDQVHSVPRSTRTYSTEPSSINTGTAPLPHRRLILLSGHDAAKFLQGLVTNNVDSTRLSPFYTAFLDARGRVLWDVFIWVWPELVAKQGHWSCYIEVDQNEVEALKKHIKKHKLRSKFEVKDVPTEGAEGMRVWAAWGGAHTSVRDWSEIAGFKDPRSVGMYRYLTNAHRETIAEGLQPVDTKYYHLQRYIDGVAEGQHEIPRESALPMEYNIDLSGGIDFKKGCYVGQELTIRTKHTGVVRKRVLPVRLFPRSGESSHSMYDIDVDVTLPASGTDIKVLGVDGSVKKGRPTGKFIAGIGKAGLALCRLENMTPLAVTAEGGTYKEGMEFGVETDGEVSKVMPVLHPWFVLRRKQLWDSKKEKAIVRDED